MANPETLALRDDVKEAIREYNQWKLTSVKRASMHVDLFPVYDDFMREMTIYMNKVRPPIQSALGVRLSGTWTNLETGLEAGVLHLLRIPAFLGAGSNLGSDFVEGYLAQQALAKRANDVLRSGCEAVSATTIACINQSWKRHGNPNKWYAHKFMVGNGLEHHAVCVERRGTNLQKYIFDPWITQKPAVYRLEDWSRRFKNWAMLGKPRTEY